MSISESTIERYTHADPEVRLMLRVRAGDAAAFEELMRGYQSRMVSLMAHLVGRRDMAEDLAQEVFLRVYRARERYVPGAKFSTWLFTIANNVASNALRTLSRRKESSVAPAPGDTGGNPLEQLAPESSALMPGRLADKAEVRRLVAGAIEGLNERQRTAVLLAKFEHLSYAEIGEVMGLTPQAIKSLLCRAREKLREQLEPYLQPDEA